MRWRKRAGLVAVLGVVVLTLPARAAAFDYFVLALSWTPGWCALEGDARGDERCDGGARAGWLVHGLWPQYQKGDWPEFCQTSARPASRAQTAAMVDIMGSAGLAWHQWRKHGTCAQMSAGDYFAATRAAFARVQPPELFTRIDRDLRLDPQLVEAAFIEETPDLAPDMMVVTCPRGIATEMRVCLDRSLQPRTCDAPLLARACARDTVRLPALR